MQNHIRLQQRALQLIEQLRQRLLDPGLCARHRRRPTDFIRERVLTFPVLMLWLLQKNLTSLQAPAHEFFWQLCHGLPACTVSASAVTHARAKLRPSAFGELNQTVLDTV